VKPARLLPDLQGFGRGDIVLAPGVPRHEREGVGHGIKTWFRAHDIFFLNAADYDVVVVLLRLAGTNECEEGNGLLGLLSTERA